MNKQKDILAAFLQERLATAGLALDEEVLSLFNRHVILKEREPDESKEYRKVRMKEDSARNLSAHSIKLWNISQVSLYDLIGFLGKETGILLFDDTAKKAIYSLLMLLFEFYPKLRIDFNEQDAKVLFAISRLKKKAFDRKEVAASFEDVFYEPLPEKRLLASLRHLKQVGVLRALGEEQYQLREKIKELKR